MKKSYPFLGRIFCHPQNGRFNFLHSRISGEAAVNGENNAGYKARLTLVAEEQQSARQILRHAEAGEALPQGRADKDPQLVPVPDLDAKVRQGHLYYDRSDQLR